MQHIVKRRSHIHIIFVAATILTVLEQIFEIFQVLFQVGLLLSLQVFLLGVVHNDIQAVSRAETFLVDIFHAHATGIGTRLIERPDVAASHVVATDVGFLEFAHVYTILAALDFFDEHIDAAVHAVDIQVEMPGAGAVMPSLPKQPMGKGISHHALVHIRTMQDPVVGRRQSEQAYIHAFALLVADFDAVTRFRELGRGLPTNLDTDVIAGSLGTVGHIVRGAIKNLHGGRDFLGHILIEALALGINEHNRQIVGLR